MRTDLCDQLKRAAGARQQPKFKKLLSMPLKLGLPRALSILSLENIREAKTFFGKLQKVVLPEPVSVCVWRYGFFEEDVSFFIMSCLKPGDVFIDVGGHFGFFSMLGAELVGSDGQVITFEPMPETRKMLQDNMARNAAPCSSRIVPAAAGRERGTLTFADFGIVGSAYATGQQPRSDKLQKRGKIEVEVFSIDEVVEELAVDRVDLIKIDAENAEADVLAGAQRTIEQWQPSIIIEVGDCEGSLSRPLIVNLIQQGYVPYEFSEFELKIHQVKDVYNYQNILMKHRNRPDFADLTDA